MSEKNTDNLLKEDLALVEDAVKKVTKAKGESDCLPGTDIPKDSIAATVMKSTEDEAEQVSLQFYNHVPDTKQETEVLVGDILDNPEKYSDAIGEWAMAVYSEAMNKAQRKAAGEKMPKYVAKPRPKNDEEAENWFTD